MSGNLNWELLNTSLQLVQTVAVLAALIYGWQEIKHARQESRLDSLWNIHSELSAEPQRQARRSVYKHRQMFASLPDKPEELYNIPEDVLSSAHSVGNTFNRIGYMVHLGLIPGEIILGGYATIIARSWIVLEPFVRVVRTERLEPGFQSYFESLAALAFKESVTPEDIQFTRYTDGLWQANDATNIVSEDTVEPPK